MGIRRNAFFAATLAALLLPAPAGAGHWPNAGGDAGRSGAQRVDEGGVPIEFLYSSTATTDRDVRTSIVTSAGPLSEQRFAYGTDDGSIHLRLLLTGAPVGPAAGTDISAAPDPFGGGSGSVSPVDASTPNGPGQIYALHNEVSEGGTVGVQLAQVDAVKGDVLRQVDVAGTTGYRVQSSPLLTPADSSGNRSLFFVAEERNGANQRLFKVPITNASAVGAQIGA